MNIEEQLLALIEEGNPIPDPDALSVNQSDSTVYLATLTQRSSEVTQLETKQKLENRPKQTPWIWLVAAIVVAGVSLFALNRVLDDSPPATEPTTTVQSTTTAAADTAAVEDAISSIAAALGGVGTLPSVEEDVVFDDDPLTDYIGFSNAVGTRVTFTECVINNALATCRGIRTNRILEAMGLAEEGTWIFRFNEAWANGDTGSSPILVELIHTPDPESRLFYGGTPASVVLEEDYLLWMNSTHPEWRTERGIGPTDETPFDELTGVIFSRYISEYAEAVTEVGPPETPYSDRW